MDENIPNVTANALRVAGHDVLDIRRTAQQGLFDDEVWPLVQVEGRLLVTTNKGFAEHRNELHHGIRIVRLRQPNEQRIHARIMHGFRQFPQHQWPGTLVVMRDVVQSIYRKP